MTQRNHQISSLLHKTVATVLQRGLQDPRLDGALVSVTRVQVGDDLRNATVFVTVHPDTAQNRVVKALQDAAVHIQHAVREKVALRLVPHLWFKHDTQLKREIATLSAIHEAMERTGPDADGEAPATHDESPQ